MCGIVAVYFKNEKISNRLLPQLENSLDILKHRGPDGSGVFGDASVFLGHTRLAIIDLSEDANQPMLSRDGNFQIIFNGEIYNYVEIKEELSKESVEFRTTSDTEVLLESLIRWGIDALPKLNGMFGFVIWDSHRRKMTVVRDRYGIKPIYYYDDDEITIFASEIKAILPFVKSITPNDSLIFDYLQNKKVDHEDDTFFNAVKRVPAGYYIEVENGSLKLVRWYDLHAEINKVSDDPIFKSRSEREHIEMVKQLFFDSVRIRLRSDVRVGSCLSGGIDSSSIVAIGSHFLGDEAKNIFESYSAVYGSWFKLDETRYIREVLEFCNLRGNFVTPTAETLDAEFTKLVYHQEEPFTTTSIFSGYCVMQLAHRNGAKVLLDGQGADELLAGYDYMVSYYLAELFRSAKLLTFMREVIAQIRRKNKSGIKMALRLIKSGRSKSTETWKLHSLINQSFGQRFAGRPLPRSRVLDTSTLNTGLADHITYNFQHLLRWEDRNSMAFSIETRLPFLDYHLVAYLLALPPKYKIRNGVTKWIFRQALSLYVPSLVMQRRDKIGFATPEMKWLNDSELGIISDLKHQYHPMMEKYILMNDVQDLLNKYKDSIDDEMWNFIFRVACLNRWFQVFYEHP